ncbi:SprT family zinc-dependent metalloprotease [uncultured Sphingomonas sp.]|uniref:M48 family metallopeptidase n=1 Tax=uncultured Sphingomonas sp. TaxID=158754 RepID=UPI0025DC6135|nr:SprT family zinc-dependent metalloprotease [uncultured Sphingomonas sp.]
MRLAVDPRDGRISLTLPRRAALQPALDWAESQRPWIEAALAKTAAPRPLGDGTTLPFRGEMLTIRVAGGARAVRVSGDQLLVGGPAEMVGARVLRWLREQARIVLEAETRRFAGKAGVTVGRVRIGDPRSRWGSCSSGGDIAYSWRLILAPPAVLEATVAHEVGHRLHMDHSPAFHAAVEALLGRDPRAERTWLRTRGAGLHAIGRTD